MTTTSRTICAVLAVVAFAPWLTYAAGMEAGVAPAGAALSARTPGPR